MNNSALAELLAKVKVRISIRETLVQKKKKKEHQQGFKPTADSAMF